MKQVMRVLILMCMAVPAAMAQTSIGAFTGGDVGEGLDLDGSIVYAVNVGGPAVGPIRSANFTDETAPGVTVTAQTQVPDWALPNYGATANDNNLETVMQTMRFSDFPTNVEVALANLVPGTPYQLQLLFTESCCDRGFNVFVEGVEIAHDFSPQAFSGVTPTPTAGAVVTRWFNATDTTANITLSGVGSSFNDKNPTLSAVILEANALPPAPIPALDARMLILLAMALAAVGAVVLRRVV